MLALQASERSKPEPGILTMAFANLRIGREHVAVTDDLPNEPIPLIGGD
jgi:hypothetical protein